MPDGLHTLAPRCREREPSTSSAFEGKAELVSSIRDTSLEEAVDIAQRRHLGSYLPCHDDFVSDIGVHFAAISADDIVYVKEEAGEKLLYSQLTHRLGE